MTNSPGARKAALAALALFALNVYITAPLFRIEFLTQMGSNEGVYIGLARYIREHFPHFTWFPLWYGGIPYQYSYPPLLHFIVAAVATAAHASNARAYHIVTATLYALGPVALFWTARRLGTSRAAAFLAGLAYSVISPSCFLVRLIRVAAGGWFGPWRLVGLVDYGDAPHVAALMLLTLAIGALHVALERRRPLDHVGAVVLLAAVALTNWIGAFALALVVACYLPAGWDDARGLPWLPRWRRIAAIGCFAYALALPWVTPTTIWTIQTNAPKLFGWKSTASEHALAAVMVAGILLLAVTLRRRRVGPRVRFAAMFLWSTAAITLGASWLHTEIVPSAQRYGLEMDVAFWLAAALSADSVAARLRGRAWTHVRKYAGLAVAAACLPVALYQHRRALQMENPIEIAGTAECRISRWLGAHMPGRRVFAPGSVGLWMNTFTDTPMIVGGFANGIRNQLLWAVNYQIYAGDRLENTLAWLKALGCDAIVGDDAASHEFYHPYTYPGKFHPLRELWRDGPEVIYAVPRARTSLAHVLRPPDLLWEAPFPTRVELLEPFLTALDDPSLPAADFQWRNPGAAVISTDLRPGQLLYVQISWDQGWNARVNGEPRKTWADGLGQMVVEPRCNGPCTVELAWDGGTEMRLARNVSRAALLAGLFWILWRQLSRKRLVATVQSRPAS